MIYSMTGYGRGTSEIDGINHTVEIKSLNSKFAEIRVKLPFGLQFLEIKVLQYVKSRINRGRIEVLITRKSSMPAGTKVSFNKDIAEQYIEAMKKIQEEFSILSDISMDALVQADGIFELSSEPTDAEDIWNQIHPALESAMDSLLQMRKIEAENILKDVNERIERIKNIAEQIRQQESGTPQAYFDTLKERIQKLMNDTDIKIDDDRLYTELALIADKSDITEELVRLESHIAQFQNYITKGKSPIGRKIDFIIQEMNRETNTIASKTHSANTSAMVVECKSEIEKIREQVQNIE